jgi:hypothetical protein
MKLFTKYMTRNDCYTAGRKITHKGIMVHSTAVPGVMAADWFSRWNKSYKAGEINRQVCIHAFVDDKEVWQYLPWDHRGWHAGGAANNTHIGYSMIHNCEQPLNMRPFLNIRKHAADAGTGFSDCACCVNLKSKNAYRIKAVAVVSKCFIHSGISHKTPHHAPLAFQEIPHNRSPPSCIS